MLGRWLPHRLAAAVADVGDAAGLVAEDSEAIRPEEGSAETLAADSVDVAEEDREEDVEVEEEKWKEAPSKQSANPRLKEVRPVNKLGMHSCINKRTAASFNNPGLHYQRTNNCLHLFPGRIISNTISSTRTAFPPTNLDYHVSTNPRVSIARKGSSIFGLYIMKITSLHELLKLGGRFQFFQFPRLRSNIPLRF